MSKVTITTSKPNRKNLTCVMGGVVVKFDENLTARIDAADLNKVVAADPKLSYIGKPEEAVEDVEEIIEDVAKEESADKVNKDQFQTELDKAAGIKEGSENPEIPNTKKTAEEIDADKVEINFAELTVTALKDIATEAGLPKADFRSLKKVALVAYLKKQLK